jgi:4-hydroxy 2-oxovalerate aldolase
MMAHMSPPDTLAEQAAIMAAAGAQVVYVTDSAGALVPDGVRRRVAALRDVLPADVAVGFHGHQNLSLAVGNSLAAVETGATWIDGCLCGLGAGAGNAPTEALAAALERAGETTGLETLKLLRVAEDVGRPLWPAPPHLGESELLLGYAGVYSSFLLHAARAAQRFGVSAAEIIVELGRRNAVGGQEDLIVDVATELARGAGARR